MNSKLTFEEALAVARGENLEEYREKAALRKRILEASQKYVDSPVDGWPKIKINWDVSKGSQRHCFDGVSIEEFSKYHPSGLLLGYVELKEFDNKLCHFSRRDTGELWELGSPSKLAYLIVYLSEGHPISPPVPKPVDKGEIILMGGHHRYAIAKAIGEDKIPICIYPEHKSRIDERINVKWKHA